MRVSLRVTHSAAQARIKINVDTSEAALKTTTGPCTPLCHHLNRLHEGGKGIWVSMKAMDMYTAIGKT